MSSWLPGPSMDYPGQFKVTQTTRFSVLDVAGPGETAPKAKANATTAKAPNASKKAKAAPAEEAGGGGGGGAAPRWRLDHILENERRVQELWDQSHVYESDPIYNADGSKKPKYMVTFPYPYMNGRLHLGHAFSLTKAIFAAAYKRLKGHNVLFPFGFHCTGMPIQAAANKLKAEIAKFGNPPEFPQAQVEEKKADGGKKGGKGGPKTKVAQKSSGTTYQWQTLEKMNIPFDEIASFAEPVKWLEYFPPFGVADLKAFGTGIDFRRSFITTSRNPYYNAFIEWQFRVLRKGDKVVFGKRPCIYSPLDQQVCADHDRSKGEGVAPQEYTLIKLAVLEPFPECLAPLAGEKVFLTPATLRPETMYGQTNCFVLPEGEYGAFKWANGDVYIMSERSAKNLAFQSYKNVDYASTWGQPECLLKVMGQALLGTKLKAPRAPYEFVYTLPLLSISMGKGTGVVTSVPSDAPDDFIALKELQDKPEYCAKLGIDHSMVADYAVVPIINITVPATGDEEGWSSDQAAEYWCTQLKIKTPKDRVKLDEAKKKTYNTGFAYGRMLVGTYAGEEVKTAKPKEKQDMVDAGEALIYFEPEDFVESRTGQECVVSLLDQWFLKYGDAEWRSHVEQHVNSENFNAYSQEILDKFNFTLGWLKEWACSRLFGLGTQLPWDDKWVIESLSDSTIYMAYYTIAHLLQGPDNLCGDSPSPCGITPDQLNDAVFDYIFLGAPAPADTTIPMATLDELKASFEYWYPMDLRVSGKDLIGNHLTMSLYNHAAVWPDRPDLWPRSIYTNGFVMVDNKKMAKSEGNFLMLEQCVREFSADATRFACADAGDTLMDANFERKVAESSTMSIYNEEEFIKEMLAAKGKGELRTGDTLALEGAILKEMDRLICETDKQYSKMFWRNGVGSGAFQYRILRDFYRDWCEKQQMAPHDTVIMRWIETSVLILSPICPHFAENAWQMLGKQGTILQADWPATAPIDAIACRSLNFLKNTIKHLRNSKEVVDARKKGTTFTVGYLYVADSYSDWKIATLKFMQTLWDQEEECLPEKKVVLQAVTKDLLKKDPALEKQKKNIMQFASFQHDESYEGMGFDALETDIPFNQKQVLDESLPYICKALLPNSTLDITVYELSKGDAPGPDTKKEKAEPGKPTMAMS